MSIGREGERKGLLEAWQVSGGICLCKGNRMGEYQRPDLRCLIVGKDAVGRMPERRWSNGPEV